MKVLGVIPARGGSKGIPGKNIKRLAGKPLIAYTSESAKKSNLLSRVILSSDSEEIIKVARDLGIEVPFRRPEVLAQDSTPTLEVVRHAVKYFISRGEEFQAICLLQPTSPVRGEGLIDTAIEKFVSGNYDSLISVREVPAKFNPHWIFEEEDGKLRISTGEKEIIPRRQDLPTAFFRDGAIYLVKVEVLLEQDSLYGEKIGYIKSSGPYVNLDVPEDWDQAEILFKKNF